MLIHKHAVKHSIASLKWFSFCYKWTAYEKATIYLDGSDPHDLCGLFSRIFIIAAVAVCGFVCSVVFVVVIESLIRSYSDTVSGWTYDMCVCEFWVCQRECLCVFPDVWAESTSFAEYEPHMHLNSSYLNCIPAFRSEMFSSASEKPPSCRV